MGEHRFAGTMQKMKKGNVTGAYRHNERIYEKHSNKDIDVSKSHLNYKLISTKNTEEIIAYIDENKSSKRATRKDAVVVNEWIFSDMAEQDDDGNYIFDGSGDDQTKRYFLKDMPLDEQRRYFQECFDYMAENYGEENMAYAVVHMDETSPHMHVGVVPMEDGKLSSKKMFNQYNLLKIQRELPERLQKEGFSISRGLEGNKRAKLTVKAYKEAQDEIKEIAISKEKVAEASRRARITDSKQHEAAGVIMRRQEAVIARGKLLDGREQQLEQKEQKVELVLQKEQEINQKEQQLIRKEQQLVQKEQQMESDEQARQMRNNKLLQVLASLKEKLEKQMASNLEIINKHSTQIYLSADERLYNQIMNTNDERNARIIAEKKTPTRPQRDRNGYQLD